MKIYQKLFLYTLLVLFFPSLCHAQTPPVPNPQNSGRLNIVSAVAAKPNVFQIALTSSDINPVAVYDELTYQVNYGSYLSSNIQSLKISIEWSRGTLSGSSTPSIDILDYIVGSGSTAFGGAQPVIDINNRRVEWTITNFPSNLQDQIANIKLRVNNSYVGKSNVNFNVKAYITGLNTSTVSNTINKYLAASAIELIPTIASNPSETIDSLTPTPTPGISTGDLSIIKISMANISTDSVVINTFLSKNPNEIKIIFGKSISNLTQSIISVNQKSEDQIKIDGLTLGTDYYFKVIATDDKSSVTSDIYTFKTSTDSFVSNINKKSLIISADNNILLDSKSETDDSNSVVVIPDQEYGLRVNIDQSEFVKSVKVTVQNTKVLGITTSKAELNSKVSDLIQLSPGYFSTHLISPKNQGFYDIIARVEDTKGNVRENKIGSLRVINPLTVYNRKNKPIENAKVTFYLYDAQTNIYKLISQDSIAIKNPSYTDFNGQVRVVLPRGKYQVEVSDLAYSSKKVNFTIGLDEIDVAPKIVLIRSSITIPQLIGYYHQVYLDVLEYFSGSIYNISASNRFFVLTGIIISIMTIISVWHFVSNFYKISWWFLPLKLIVFIKEKISKLHSNRLYGEIIDSQNGSAVAGAVVYLLDISVNKVLFKTITNHLGEFHINTSLDTGYRITVVKKGYDSSPITDYTKEGIQENNLIISLDKTKENSANFFKAEFIVKWFFQSFYLLMLFFMLFLELIFSNKLGFGLTWIRLLIVCFNIILWFFTVFNLHENKKNI